MRLLSSMRFAVGRLAAIFQQDEPPLIEHDARALRRLQWLLDAPLFVDETLVTRIFDAVVRPEFEVQSREIGSSSEAAQRRLSGGEASVGAKINLPFITSGSGTAKVLHQRESGTKRTNSQKQVEIAVNSIGRKLEEIAAVYIGQYDDRVLFLDSDGSATTFDGSSPSIVELEKFGDEPPRALVFLELAPETPIMPMACELSTGRVLLLYENYIKKVFSSEREAAPKYPSDKDSTPETRAAYWTALTQAFKSRSAMEVVERAGNPDDDGKSGKLAWIDFRVPLGGAHTLHLHCVPDGTAHTGVFGYNFVRRGFRQGVRVVGTLKAGLDLNVLAIFDR